MVPQDHLLRKIDQAIDFFKIKDRENHGEKPFSDDDDNKKSPEEKETVVSTTDPESSAEKKACRNRAVYIFIFMDSE